ncbi:MAG: hypothetical protein WCR30_00215 [Clostridia bacterium]
MKTKKQLNKVFLVAISALLMFASTLSIVASSGFSSGTSKDNASQMWFVIEPRLAKCSEEYTNLSYDPIITAYHEPSGGGFQVVGDELNDEKYALRATDSTGETIRLIPQHLTTEIYNSNGAVSIVFDNILSLPNGFCYQNDSRVILGAKVGTGKIYYARRQNGVYNSWSNANLQDNQTITISYPYTSYIKILLLYEIKEFAPNIFRPNKYYHVYGEYEFMVNPE